MGQLKVRMTGTGFAEGSLYLMIIDRLRRSEKWGDVSALQEGNTA